MLCSPDIAEIQFGTWAHHHTHHSAYRTEQRWSKFPLPVSGRLHKLQHCRSQVIGQGPIIAAPPALSSMAKTYQRLEKSWAPLKQEEEYEQRSLQPGVRLRAVGRAATQTVNGSYCYNMLNYTVLQIFGCQATLNTLWNTYSNRERENTLCQ